MQGARERGGAVSSANQNADFHNGLIGWGGGDVAGKVMIDNMNNNADPRLRAMFEPGASAPAGTYIGLNPSLSNTEQTDLVSGGTLARYNRSTLSQNIYLPGMLINAAEVNFFLAEYYLNAGNDASAKSGSAPAAQGADEVDTIEYPEEDINPEDIPF